MPTNAQLDARIKALEAWRKTAADQIAALLAAPATDYSTQIAALAAGIAALKATTCPEATRLDAFEAALDTLTGDHVPEV